MQPLELRSSAKRDDKTYHLEFAPADGAALPRIKLLSSEPLPELVVGKTYQLVEVEDSQAKKRR